MQNPNPRQNPANELWAVRLELAFDFVIILSMCFSIYQGLFQADAEDFNIFTEIFHVPEDFDIDHMEIEKNFKIFVYPHNSTILCDKPRKLDGEYGNEGLFIENLMQSRFLIKDPDKAHLFLIPIYCHSLPPEGRSANERSMSVQDFIKSLISEYPYWNRTLGSDHFIVTCEDINVTATGPVANLLKNSIRVMCSPSYNVEYVHRKDVSLPQSVQPFNYSASGIDPYWNRISSPAHQHNDGPEALSVESTSSDQT